MPPGAGAAPTADPTRRSDPARFFMQTVLRPPATRRIPQPASLNLHPSALYLNLEPEPLNLSL
jgi:hypothetical protein